MLKNFRRTTPPTKIFLHRNFLANTSDQVPVEKIASSTQSAAPGRRDQREKYPTNVNGRATEVLNTYARAYAALIFHTVNISLFLLFSVENIS
jgi:hypothetical protein